MGTFAQAFESGSQSAKEGIFSNLVTLARVDGRIDQQEADLLERIARRLSLTAEQAKEIMNHPEDFPMIPPVQKQERFERLIQFIQMTFIDGVIDPAETKMVIKYGIGLGFNDDEAHSHAEAILIKVKEGVDADAILSDFV